MKGDFMDLDKFTIYDRNNLITALKKIDDNNHRFLVILNKNRKVVGTLTDGDIRRALIHGVSTYEEVGQLINKDFKYVYEESTLFDIVESFKSPK